MMVVPHHAGDRQVSGEVAAEYVPSRVGYKPAVASRIA